MEIELTLLDSILNANDVSETDKLVAADIKKDLEEPKTDEVD